MQPGGDHHNDGDRDGDGNGHDDGDRDGDVNGHDDGDPEFLIVATIH